MQTEYHPIQFWFYVNYFQMENIKYLQTSTPYIHTHVCIQFVNKNQRKASAINHIRFIIYCLHFKIYGYIYISVKSIMKRCVILEEVML